MVRVEILISDSTVSEIKELGELFKLLPENYQLGEKYFEGLDRVGGLLFIMVEGELKAMGKLN